MGALPAETLISWLNQTCASQYRLCLVFLQILLYFQNLALGVFCSRCGRLRFALAFPVCFQLGCFVCNTLLPP